MADVNELYVRAYGGWKRCNYSTDDTQHGFFVRVNGTWTRVEEAYVRADGSWKQFFGPETVEPPPTKPPAGTYILPATALYLGSETNGYAEFNTEAYRGYITQIRARVSWKYSGTFTSAWSGRPNGNFYRNIDPDFGGQTIDHRIDTFDASSLTDFNSGAAIGFSFTKPSGTTWSTWISNVQLNLTIS
jgi:hypothetical protein